METVGKLTYLGDRVIVMEDIRLLSPPEQDVDWLRKTNVASYCMERDCS